jgi:hypothetical protein
MSQERSNLEHLHRLRMTLRQAGEQLLELQEQLIALRFAMSPSDDDAVHQATQTCIENAVRR